MNNFWISQKSHGNTPDRKTRNKSRAAWLFIPCRNCHPFILAIKTLSPTATELAVSMFELSVESLDRGHVFLLVWTECTVEGRWE